MAFLDDLEPRPIELREGGMTVPARLALGQGSQALEVVSASLPGRPTKQSLLGLWRTRRAGRATPILLVALYDGKAAICGPSGEDPPCLADLQVSQVERLCRAAVREPDRHAAVRFLREHLPEVESPIPGLRNVGLLATHELQRGVPKRPDWTSACEKGKAALTKRGAELLGALGYEIEHLVGPASVLRSRDTKIAVALLLERGEHHDVSSERFGGHTPVHYGLSKADNENLRYVLVAAGPSLRLYSTSPSLGVGRRGRTETYVEAHLDLLREDQAGYLSLLFGAEALAESGTLGQIIESSSRFAAGLGENLRERVYRKVVPSLSQALVKAQGLHEPTVEDLKRTYEMALYVLYRLLFVAYAEDLELLPYRENELYRARSLKQKARDLQTIVEKGGPFDPGSSHWEETVRLFHAIDGGQREWGVPTYDGGLFSTNPSTSPIGAALESVKLSNEDFGPILSALLLDETGEGLGPVDFRSLGVREFGTVYEGLLESELSVAETDLGVDREGNYRPVTDPTSAIVREGAVYIHNGAGARKASGTYFTKAFAVDHLLDHALEPALQAHVERLDALGEDEAGDAFFDFRVADIAMGSGHFLVGAVDRIERKLSTYYANRKLPVVRDELSRLRAKAFKALGPLGEGREIEETQLLRRQIARRCIYGVDINPIAVELARLSLWVHTFVPGLPLSNVEQNLAVGNSLVGIATFDEALELLGSDVQDLFLDAAKRQMEGVRKLVERLGRFSDADRAEVQAAREAAKEAQTALKPIAALFDVLAASRLSPEIRADLESGHVAEWLHAPETLPDSKAHKRAREALRDSLPFHFPIAFPGVFLRERAGFDCILGNPPWQEATLEEHAFWARHVPGLRGLTQQEQERVKAELRAERPDLVHQYQRELAEAEAVRRALVSGPYPGMGTGDPDLYKAFCWRFRHLTAKEGGWIGVVLPRSVWNAKGSTEFRQEVFANCDPVDLTFVLNTGGWVFDDMEPRYTISFTALRSGQPQRRSVWLHGPFASLERFVTGVSKPPATFTAEEVQGWTDTASLPLLPTEESLDVFAQLRRSPRLDVNEPGQWRARPYAELHATNDKSLMDVDSDSCPVGFWPVYKGESFDIWNPDTGSYYAFADPDLVVDHLYEKRLGASRNRKSPFSEFPQEWVRDRQTLPCNHARIAFRDITNRTNQRTVVAALIPPRVFITNKGPYMLWPRGSKQDEAFLLGVMASIPLDWYSRRFVETNLNFFVLNPFPIPRPEPSNPSRQRVIELAGRLACPDLRFADWAREVGVECGPLAPDEKEDMIRELDAVVAHLYGLSEAQLAHVFETFHEGWDYQDRLDGTLRHFRAWEGRA